MKVISICEGACGRVRSHLDSFRVDELPTETMRVVLRHLLQCQACLRQLQIADPRPYDDDPLPPVTNRVVHLPQR